MPRPTLAVTAIATLLAFPAFFAMADEAPWVADARNIATSMPPKMIEVLKEETRKGGPANATVVCREKAPLMSKAVSEQSGWNIRRVSLRVRNPKAVPDDWERAVLEDFDRRAAAGESGATMEKSELVVEGGKTVQRYMKALPTQALCMTCHGAPDTLDTDLTEQLRKLYPDDKAVGYRPGDIRGAITMKKSPM